MEKLPSPQPLGQSRAASPSFLEPETRRRRNGSRRRVQTYLVPMPSSDFGSFKDFCSFFGPKTSCKYWKKASYGLYNPDCNQLYLRIGHNCYATKCNRWGSRRSFIGVSLNTWSRIYGLAWIYNLGFRSKWLGATNRVYPKFLNLHQVKICNFWGNPSDSLISGVYNIGNTKMAHWMGVGFCRRITLDRLCLIVCFLFRSSMHCKWTLIESGGLWWHIIRCCGDDRTIVQWNWLHSQVSWSGTRKPLLSVQWLRHTTKQKQIRIWSNNK